MSRTDVAGGPLVVDLVRSGSSTVEMLLDAADRDVVMIDGTPCAVGDLWLRVLGDAIAGTDRARTSVIVGVPSEWGAPRRHPIEWAVSRLGGDIEIVPRAVLVARSHADVAARRCLVVETTRSPRYGGRRGSTDLTWTLSVCTRVGGDWVIETSAAADVDAARVAVVEVGGLAVADASAIAGDEMPTSAGTCTIGDLVDDSLEAVFIDGDDAAQVRLTRLIICDLAVAGRVVPVDATMVARFGGRGVTRARVDHPWFAEDSADDPVRMRRRRWAVTAGVVVASIVCGLGGAWVWRSEASAVEASTVVLDRVELTVPAGWRRTDQDSDAGAGGPQRTVFVNAADNRRLLVVRSQLRDGATLETVATSLGNRVRQRGDDVVTEFSSSTRYRGREVISYREAPGSGSPIRWYVLVDQGLQVSVGCQGGDAGESLESECGDSVESVRVTPAG